MDTSSPSIHGLRHTISQLEGQLRTKHGVLLNATPRTNTYDTLISMATAAYAKPQKIEMLDVDGDGYESWAEYFYRNTQRELSDLGQSLERSLGGGQ